MNRKTSSFLLFMIGLLSWTRIHVIGMIGVAELVCLFVGPILFVKDFAFLRRHGFLKMCCLWLATCIGCLIAAAYNHCEFYRWIRGFATPLTTFCLLCVIYHLMRGNLDGLRWLILGWSLTGVFTAAIFGRGFASLLGDEGEGEFGAIMRMYIFLPLVLIPTRCWYTKTPVWFSVMVSFLFGLYALKATASGRSTSLIFLAGALLILIGGKSIKKMAALRRHFFVLLLGAVVFAFVAKIGYSKAATSGILGERARLKYEQQTHGNSSMLALLMGGRIQFFAGAYAALEQPIFGYGPWPLDKKGIYEEFLAKYGDADDARIYANNLKRLGVIGEVPTHSHIVGFWVWYGISGLLLWLYVIYIVIAFFVKYIDVMPQWYGMFATLTPLLLWGIFFSPFGERTETAGLITAILLARAVAKGKLCLSQYELIERRKYLP